MLTPRACAAAHVARAARATFVERGVHDTRDRSGLLVYISWLEQQIALVADSGARCARCRAEATGRAEAALNGAMARGGAAVARALDALAPELATRCPAARTTSTSCPTRSTATWSAR